MDSLAQTMNASTVEDKCDGHACDIPDEEQCQMEDAGYICTQPKNHTGPHIACGNIQHNYHLWLSPSSVGEQLTTTNKPV